MKNIRYPNLYSKYDLETKFEALENAITDLIEAVEEIRSPEPSTESPKPDWVKEEIKEMMQPSRQLLWETFLKGHNAAAPIRKEFNEWIQTLPPDTLKEDRELVASLFNVAIWINREPHPAIEFSFADGNHRKEFENALKRLCGMEVGNG